MVSATFPSWLLDLEDQEIDMRAYHRLGRTFVTLVAAGVPVVLTSPAWAAEDTTSEETKPPSLSIEGADSLEFVLRGTDDDPSMFRPKTWPAASSDLNGESRVVVSNSGGEAATVSFKVVMTSPTPDCVDEEPTFEPDTPVPASGSMAYNLKTTMSRDCVGENAVLIVSGTGAEGTSDPKSADIALNRHIGGWEYGPPLVAAALAFLLFLLLAGLSTIGKWTKRTPGGDAWSFGGSWLTSISAVGTALAGVLAATGFVAELLPVSRSDTSSGCH
jgi:hypothetical protein